MHNKLFKEYELFEQNFNTMLREINNGVFNKKSIDLSGAPLTKRHLQQLRKAFAANYIVAGRIERIDLSSTKITEIPFDIFKDCDSLRILILDNNNLRELPKLPDRPAALHYFSASNNPIKHLPANYFKNCSSLTDIYLNASKLKIVPKLADSLSLNSLDLQNNDTREHYTKYNFAKIPAKIRQNVHAAIENVKAKEITKIKEINAEFGVNVDMVLMQIMAAVTLLRDFNIATNNADPKHESCKLFCNLGKHHITRLRTTLNILEKFITKNKKHTKYFEHEFSKQLDIAGGIMNLGYKMIDLIGYKVKTTSTITAKHKPTTLSAYIPTDKSNNLLPLRTKIMQEFDQVQNYLQTAQQQAATHFKLLRH
jgi:Leucine-rich repeat (LRR) protein